MRFFIWLTARQATGRFESRIVLVVAAADAQSVAVRIG
jgi:hypothetical protein